MKKKKGFILYFDVLGYKNILRNNSELENEKIADIFNQFSTFFSKSNVALGYGTEFDKDKLYIKAFSDNFLFVYELNENDYKGLNTLQLVATLIQNQFLKVGLLTRGSITYGEISYNDYIVFGIDLINAVELEENHKMPSIVVDPKLQKIFEGTDLQFKNEVDLFNVWPNSKIDYEECIDGINKYLVQLNKTYVNNDILEKIDWVIHRLNDYFEDKQKISYKLMNDYHYYIKKEDK